MIMKNDIRGGYYQIGRNLRFILSFTRTCHVHMGKKGKKDISTSFKRSKWPIRPIKRLHLKCYLISENNKSK